MKKALIVTRVSGFLPQFEMNNVKILQEMGYEVHYAANYQTIVYGKDNSRLEGTGIIQHQIDFCRSPFSPKVRESKRQLAQLLEKEEFDLIHCHMPMSGVVTRIVAEKTARKTGRKIPVIYTAHGLHFYTGAPLKNWLYYPVERYLARYTDCLILINEEDFQRAQKFPVRGRVEQTKGVGMQLERFEHIPEPEESIRQKYQIPDQHAIIVSVGELTKRKNNIVVIEAMKELGDIPLTYLICGSGPMEKELKKRVVELGLEKRVKFAGYVTEVPQILAQSDAFVFPSFQEGLPVAVMEAMAVGKPVIATDIRGIRDLIEHAKGGYLVQDWEPENYAVKIRRMFREECKKSEVDRVTRRRQMGEWNQEKIKEFSLELVDARMRKIYKEVVENKK